MQFKNLQITKGTHEIGNQSQQKQQVWNFTYFNLSKLRPIRLPPSCPVQKENYTNLYISTSTKQTNI